MHGHWYGIRTERLYRSIAIEVRDRDGEFNVVSSHSIYRYRHIDLSLCSFLLLAIALPIQSFFCFASFLSVFPCVCVIFFAFWVHCVRFFCYFLFHFIGLIRLWTHISLSLCMKSDTRSGSFTIHTMCFTSQFHSFSVFIFRVDIRRIVMLYRLYVDGFVLFCTTKYPFERFFYSFILLQIQDHVFVCSFTWLNKELLWTFMLLHPKYPIQLIYQ